MAPFCGFAVHGQGFHFIKSTCEQGMKDTAICALITVKSGTACARQTEVEFKKLAGPNSAWRWYAKKISENQFQMCFPNNAQKVVDLSHFTEMRMRTDDG